MVKNPELPLAFATDDPNPELRSEEQLTGHFSHRLPQLFLQSKMESLRKQIII